MISDHLPVRIVLLKMFSHYEGGSFRRIRPQVPGAPELPLEVLAPSRTDTASVGA